MRASRIAAFLSLVGLVLLPVLPGCTGKPAQGAGPLVEGRPVESQAPNARDQEPAFDGQTRAMWQTENVAFETEVIARGLSHPWSLAFLPGGEMLVTEKPGRLRIVEQDGTVSAAVEGVPEVDARGQGGLLDVALDPSFADNNVIYLTYAEREGDRNGTALARATLVREESREPRLADVRVIWQQRPKIDSTKHYGSRIVFDRTGAILVTVGERSIDAGRHQAQELDATFGKVVRVNPDGTIPKDNPFVDREGALPEIWSYGHRNVQAAALHPDTGELWVVDHGPRGGDEVNIAEAGKDYGWPTISYGIEYFGDMVGKGLTHKEGMEQPVYYWDPVIAPSGAVFYTGDRFPAWKGNLFVGALAGKHIARLVIDGRRIVGEERLLAGHARFRDVREGPDGLLYALTDEDDGELLRLVPR